MIGIKLEFEPCVLGKYVRCAGGARVSPYAVAYHSTDRERGGPGSNMLNETVRWTARPQVPRKSVRAYTAPLSAPGITLAWLTLLCAAIQAATVADERGEQAIAEIEKVGGTVGYDSSRPDRPIVLVEFSKSRANDSVLSHLKAFPELREFRVENAPITDSGLAKLRVLTRLDTLVLCNTRISDLWAGVD